ncbi:hypothetical protein [Acrocarpospora sp. B8E8]|uniref:hypothetical protein n=1 Tax=Acrocarpospora sp. B8E8 TaxID=3153572 RepID=UPI00325CFA7B
MEDFITALEQGRDVIGAESERIRQLLVSAELPTAGLQPIRQIEGWIGEELPRLRRRVEIIRAGDALAWLPGQGLVAYDEGKVRLPAESRKAGTALGARVAELGPPGYWTSVADRELAAGLIAELEAGEDDPDFTAAFFAALGVEKVLSLPSVLRQNEFLIDPPAVLSPLRSDERMLRILSVAFGTAVTGGAKVPGFAEIMDRVRRAAPRERQGAGLLIGAGKFPAEWLAGLVTAWGGMVQPKRVHDGVIQALGNNPEAARLAVREAVGPYTEDQSNLTELITGLNERSRQGPFDDIMPDAFGRMLAAVAGVYGQRDSRESAVFAYTVMTTLSHVQISDGTRVHLSELAGAYAVEITEGATISDANMTHDSSLEPTRSALGLGSAFTLSPEDTYHFLKTFADSAAHLAPFEEGMGRLSQRLLADELAAVTKTKDANGLEGTLKVLGNVSGF